MYFLFDNFRAVFIKKKENKTINMAACEYEELRHRNLEDNRVMVSYAPLF